MRFAGAAFAAVIIGVSFNAIGQTSSRGVTSATDELPPPASISGAALPAASESSNLSKPGFVRAIWVDSKGPALRSEAAIQAMVRACRDAGFNTIYAQVRATGDAYYNSKIVPKAPGVAEGLDPLRVLLTEAHSGGEPLKVHAQFVAFRVSTNAGTGAAINHVAKTNPDWLTETEDGNKSVGDGGTEYWLDPGLTAVQDHLALVAADLAKNYEIDGIQLDRIRYADDKLKTGYNPKAVERFNKEKKKTGKPAANDPDWIAWRRDQVTETVRKIREAARAARPGIELSAGAITFGPAPASKEEYISKGLPYNSALEDWLGWCEQGLIDTNVLMDYKIAEKNAQDFEAWTKLALENKGKAKVVIGVAGWLNQPKYALSMMLEPIFDPRADGVALYGYHEAFKGATTFGSNVALLKQALDKGIVEGKAKQIASALSAGPASGEAFSRLQQIGTAVSGGEASPNAPSQEGLPSPAPVGSMPSLSKANVETPGPPGLATLPGSAISAPSTPENMPSLASAPSSSVASSEALPGVRVAPPSVSDAAMPPLSSASPGANATPAPLSDAALPSLSALNTAKTDSGMSLPALPNVPSHGSAPTASGLSPLPPVASDIPALPPVDANAPAENSVTKTKGPDAVPDLSSVFKPMGSGRGKSPAKSPFDAAAVKKVAAQSLPPSAPSADTVNIPDYGASTNYTGAPISGPAAAVPTFVAPSVMPTPAANVATAMAMSMPVIPPTSSLPAPVEPPDYSDRTSPYATPASSGELKNYAEAGTRKPQTSLLATPASGALEVIVLVTGKEFYGRVIQRGTIWRIQLENGSIMSVPASRVARVRPR